MFDFMPKGKPEGYTGDLAQSTDTWQNLENAPTLPGPDPYQTYKDQLPNLDTTPVDTAPTTQPNIFQSILGGIKWYGAHPGQFVNEVGQGLSSGLSKLGTFQNNLNAENINATSSDPLIANFGQQQVSNLQAQQDYIKANPITTVPGMLGEQIPEIPLWMAGEGLVSKLASKIPGATELASKVPDFLLGGLKDAATYGTVVAPAESIANGDNLQQFLNRESQLPSVALGGVALRGAGKAFDTGLKAVNPELKLASELKVGELAKDNQLQSLSNPLQDIQNAYQTPSLRDVNAQDYQNIFKNVEAPSTPNNALRADNPSQYFGTTQADVQAAFPPLKVGQYSFTTGEQRAMDELTQGMQTAQNYVKHNDVLAAYPPGTSVDAAYADVKANTGVDIPKLTENLIQAQNVKTSLTPEELRMGKVAGVIPDLKARDTLAPEPAIPTVEQPTQPNIFERRTWTNKDNITPSGTPPIKSITPENVGQLPGGIKPGPGFGKADVTMEPKLQVAAAKIEKSAQTPDNYTLAAPSEGVANPDVNISGRIATNPNIFDKAKNVIKSIPEVPGKAYTALVNNLHPLARTSKEMGVQSVLDDPYRMGMLARTSRGTSDYIINHNLVDRGGNVVGEGLNSILKDIPKGLEQQFNEYELHLHNMPRYEKGKPLLGNDVSSATSKLKSEELLTAHPEFKALNQRINQFIQTLSKSWGVDSGLVESDLMKSLNEMYPNYVPGYRQLEGSSMTHEMNHVGSAKIIKSAVGGNETIIPPTESIKILVNKLVSNARKNEAFQAVLNTVRSNPEKMSKYAELVKPDEELAASMKKTVENYGMDGAAETAGNALIDHPTRGKYLVVMENGKPVTLKINNNDYWNSLKEISQPRQAGGIERAGRTLTQPFKNVVTGYNPFFATTNLVKDLPTATINSIEKNPAYAGLNMGAAIKDIATGGKDFHEFTALGGTEGNFFKNTTGVPFNPVKVVGDFNNLTEAIARFAEYKATVAKGGGTYASKLDGIHNAQEVSTNFSRHGNIVKAIDSWVPYLNPGVQGLDKIVRQVGTHPLSTVGKGLAVVTAPTVALEAINQLPQNRDAYNQLDQRTKDNNFLIPKGDGTFLKFPKSREYGVLFGSLFERLSALQQGKPEPFKNFARTIGENVAPANPLSSNYLSPIISNLPSNKDFAGRAIVPTSLQSLSPALQYDTKTSEIAKAIGKQLNVSPKQLDYLANSYLGVIAQFGVPFATKNANILAPIQQKFVADPVYSNDILNTFYDNKAKLAQGRADAKATGDKNYLVNDQYKTLVNQTDQKLIDLRKQINKVQSQPLTQNEKMIQLRDLQMKEVYLAKQANDQIKLK